MLVTQLCPSFAISWTVAPPGSSFHGIRRQDYWRGLSFPSPGGLSDLGIKSGSPTLQVDALPFESPVEEMEATFHDKF